MEENILTELKNDYFVTGAGCFGCGSLIGLKLIIQTIGRCIFVSSSSSMIASLEKENINMPFVHIGVNAAAVASGIRQSIHDIPIVVYADDVATTAYLQSVIGAARRKENIIYICNNKGQDTIDYKHGLKIIMAKEIAPSANYTATASVAYPGDFINKLKKSMTINGFSYIDLHAPCPDWGYEPSLTVEVSRTAVETGIWPLFEVCKEAHGKKVSLTKRSMRLEPIERYFEILGIKYDEETHKRIQKSVNKNWKRLVEGKLI